LFNHQTFFYDMIENFIECHLHAFNEIE